MKRSALYGLFLALLAWTAPALAQSVNLPAQTVYGRMGIGTGPGQAIPFGTLATQLGAAADPSSAFAKSIDDYGASPTNSGAANLTAIQAAIDATPAGGTIYVKRVGYNVAGQLVITKNIKVLCANADVNVAPNFTQVTASSNLIAIRSGYVTIEHCSMNLAGSPSGSATGITIGDDATQVVNGGSFTNTSTSLVCSTCTFTLADVGKGVWASNVGAAGQPLITTIAGFVNTTTVTLAVAAGGTQAAQTFAYGFNYQEITLNDLQISNYIRGIDLLAATQYHINHVYALGKFPLRLQNILWSDQGDGEVNRGTFQSTDNAAGIAVQYSSGGDLRFANNKVNGGLYCFQILWNYTTSVGPIVTGNSIEGGCSHGISVDSSVALAGGTFAGNEIGVGGTPFFVAPSATWSNWTATGNHIRAVTGNSGFDISASSNYTIANNTFENIDGTASTAYVIRATAANGIVRPGAVSTTSSTLTNLSTTTLIDDQQGMAFASLPTVAANGSRIFVTNGAPNTSPCTGSSTGSQAVRQNGAWSCGVGALPAFSVTKGGTDQTGIATATFTALTWPTVVYNINGNFASNAWTPPAGKVSLFASFNATGTITAGAQGAIAIFKNGSALRQNLNPSPTNDASASVYVEDVANGTDVYTVQAFITTSAGTATVQGATNVTYFGGHWISP